MLPINYLKNDNGFLRNSARYFCVLLAIFFLKISSAYAFEDLESGKLSLPPTLKANVIDGDQNTDIINARGNVEMQRGDNIIYSDQLSYDRKSKIIKAEGNVRVNNYKIGNLIAKQANLQDNLVAGKFDEAIIVFNDGSYLQSPEIIRQNPSQTTIDKSIFSICPNPEIASDNKYAGVEPDLISIKSKNVLIDKEKDSIKLKGATLRAYNIPFFYTPYLSMPLPSSKRKSGLLRPSYVSTSRMGPGLKLPYYFNIAPDRDLTSTVQFHPSTSNLIINNKYRKLTKNGRYFIEPEITNNKVEPSKREGVPQVNKSGDIRWYLQSRGEFEINENTGLEFDINNVGDKNYLRDYYNVFEGDTVSQVNLDHIEGRDYHSVKAVRIQNLEEFSNSRNSPNALPIINSYIESDPGAWNQRYSLLLNGTAIHRRSGVQYRRISAKPNIILPYNLAGNLFELKAGLQGDLYNIENNFENNANNDFDKFQTNSSSEISAKWSLPLINKLQNNTIIFEPMANFVISDHRNGSDKIPNEDTNSIELTQANLYLDDRFVGFDRNESGQRVSYGFKSSLFNKLGQFGFGLGQSYRISNDSQDISVSGFANNNISNLVGELSYKSNKIFNFTYNFQLDESNYSNTVNELVTSFDFDFVKINNSYLLTRKTINIPEKREQMTTGLKFKLPSNWSLYFSTDRNLAEGKTLSNRLEFLYDGCCVMYGFSVAETNFSSLTKPEKSYNINFSIKNL